VTGQAVVDIALQQVGKPYVWATAGPDTYDCSGLVHYSMKAGAGLTISRDSHVQARSGVAVTESNLQPGDVLCYDTMNGSEVREGNAISHVGLYVAPGKMVNALNPDKGVVVSDPFSNYFKPLYRGARRIVPVSPTPEPVKGTITPQTPWRTIPAVPLSTYQAEAERLASPITDLPGCHAAAGPYTALALVQAEKESTFGRDATAQEAHNPLGLMVRAGSKATYTLTSQGRKLQWFSNWPAAFAEYAARLSDHPYSDTDTVAALVRMYVWGPQAEPPPGESPASLAAYTLQVVNWINRLLGGITPVPGPAYNFGPHPWPNGFDRRILKKNDSGNGWDALGDRSKGMAITVCHHTAGHDDRDAIYNLFSAGGARANDAATDAVIDRSGKGYLLLDPWSTDPMEGSGMTPWASGPTTSLKGIGVQIVQKLGAGGVNKCGFSTEHCNVDGQGFTDAQTDLSAKVYAVVISKEKIKYDRWPYNDALGGIRVDATHDRFAPTSCAGADWPWGGGYHNAWVEAVRLEAKKLQVGGISPPTPPEPPAPVTTWPYSFRKEYAAKAWGKLRRFMPDGGVTAYAFDPAGAVAALWLARAEKEGTLQPALEWWESPPGAHWITFGVPGDVAWVLFLPDITKRADFRWVDKRDIPA